MQHGSGSVVHVSRSRSLDHTDSNQGHHWRNFVTCGSLRPWSLTVVVSVGRAGGQVGGTPQLALLVDVCVCCVGPVAFSIGDSVPRATASSRSQRCGHW